MGEKHEKQNVQNVVKRVLDALGCGLNEENAIKHANHKLTEYKFAVKKAKSYFKMVEKK